MLFVEYLIILLAIQGTHTIFRCPLVIWYMIQLQAQFQGNDMIASLTVKNDVTFLLSRASRILQCTGRFKHFMLAVWLSNALPDQPTGISQFWILSFSQRRLMTHTFSCARSRLGLCNSGRVCEGNTANYHAMMTPFAMAEDFLHGSYNCITQIQMIFSRWVFSCLAKFGITPNKFVRFL